MAVVEPLSGVAFVTLPAAPAVFCGVTCRRLPLGGYATFLAPVACPAPAVELCCWVCGVLGVSLGFLTVVMLFLRGLRLSLFPLPQVALGGVSVFPDTFCLPYCCASGVGWATPLPSVFSSLGDSLVVLLALLASGTWLVTMVVLPSPPAVLAFCAGCAVP